MELTLTEPGVYTLTTGRCRSNRVMSDKSWVAEIVGEDKKYTFSRVFLKREYNKNHGNSDTDQVFEDLREGSVYEYRKIFSKGQSAYSYGKYGGASGYFRIVAGEIVSMDKSEVRKHIKEQVCHKQN